MKQKIACICDILIFFNQAKIMKSRRLFLKTLAISPIVLAMACSDTPKVAKLAQGGRVVALGDSLTFGYGADKSQSYPVVLAQKTGWNIINMGVNGDTTKDVLNRMDSVISENPKLVLLGIGGNDVLRRVNASETRANLVSIIKALQNKNIPVVLIAEPHLSASALFGKASDNPVYKDVASEMGVPLLEKAWSTILSDDKLKSDQIHANGVGYAKFADELYQFLKEIGYV